MSYVIRASHVLALYLVCGCQAGQVLSGDETARAGDTRYSDSGDTVNLDEPDTDGDGVVDSLDNCIDDHNAPQDDWDDDSMGDACDADDDNDGLGDELDECPMGAKGWDSNVATDLDSDGCQDAVEDACSTGSDCVEGACVDQVGTTAHTCACHEGYDGALCDQDVDECAVNNGGCSDTCANLPGAFECSCLSGYELDSDQSTCIDVDECLAPSACGSNERCENQAGSYACQCQPGFVPVGGSCQAGFKFVVNMANMVVGTQMKIRFYDANSIPSFPETTMDLLANGATESLAVLGDGASWNSQIIELPGAQSCSLVGGAASGVVSGADVVQSYECAPREYKIVASVNNIVGSGLSFTNNGAPVGAASYDSDGSKNLNRMFWGDAYNVEVGSQPTGGYCIVVDGSGVMPPSILRLDVNCCLDSDQNQICDCAAGYELAAAGTVCTDVDECADLNGGCDQTCANNPGGFMCSCGAGYALNADGLTCDDVDECAVGSDGCSDTCSNEMGGFTCGCQVGEYLDADGTSCPSCAAIPNCAVRSCTTGSDETCDLCDVGFGWDASSCVPGLSVGGTMTGLFGALVLQNNGSSDLSLSADGPFVFGGVLQDGDNYEVTILTQPGGQTCIVNNGMGTLGTTSVGDVSVTCCLDGNGDGNCDDGFDDCADNASGPAAIELAITGVFASRTPTGASVSGIELTAYEDVADLSIFGVSVGAETVPEFTFPAGFLSKGSRVYLAPTAPRFLDFFGFSADYVHWTLTFHGSDPVRLYRSASVVDIFGGPGNAAISDPWSLRHGWGIRRSNTLASTIFQPDDWILTGRNVVKTSPGCNINSDDCKCTRLTDGTCAPAPLWGQFVFDDNPCGGLGVCSDASNAYTCTCDAGSFDSGAACIQCDHIAACTGGITCTSTADESCSECATGYRLTDGQCEPLYILSLNSDALNVGNSVDIRLTDTSGAAAFGETITMDPGGDVSLVGLPVGTEYRLDLLAQPQAPGGGVDQSCTIQGGGVIVLRAMPSQDETLALSCSNKSYRVRGTVEAWGGTGLEVGDAISGSSTTLSSSGTVSNFSLSSREDQTGYNVTILQQPAGQTCSILENAAGTFDGADVLLTIQCTCASPLSAFVDADADGYGAGAAISVCDIPADMAGQAGDCDDNESAINPGMTDHPDILAADLGDTDCDGVDGQISRSIFVSTGGDDVTGTGTMGNPFKTLGHAVTIADTTPGLTDVLVGAADGNPTTTVYDERVVLPSGVSLYGGYDDSDWSVRDVPRLAAIVAPSGESLFAVMVRDYATGTRADGSGAIHGLVLQTSSAPGGSAEALSSVAFLADNVSATLFVHSVTFQPGDAAVPGAVTNGTDGAPGWDGENSPDRDLTGTLMTPHGAALGGAWCGAGTNHSGGDGGSGGNGDLALPNDGVSGTPGSGASGAAGGDGGLEGLWSNASCNTASATGSPGTSGGSGLDGGGGTLPTDGDLGELLSVTLGSHTGNWAWAALAGNSGGSGFPGVAGGGGGGGGACAGYLAGLGGGGGGAGGCGGTGGQGGTGGGASAGALLINSGNVVFAYCAFELGNGTDGVRGGQGSSSGAGGSGGISGIFRLGSGDASSNFQNHQGGAGGDGGNGGNGGGGAGGAGGASTAVIVSGTGAYVLGSGNMVNQGTPGAAGLGGAAVGPASTGALGAAGLSQDVVWMP